MKILALMLACCLSASALAQEKEKTTAEKDALTNEQALSVKAGMELLGQGYNEPDAEGKSVNRRFRFSADVLMIQALNIDLGRRLEAAVSSANNALVVSRSEGADKVPEAKKGDYAVEYRKLMDQPSRIGFYHIKRKDLCLELTPECEKLGLKDGNPIPVSTLSLFVAIVDQ